MEYTINDINNAEEIILFSNITGVVYINKKEQRITNNAQDFTERCKSENRKGFFLLFYKILNGSLQEKDYGLIKLFDRVILN